MKNACILKDDFPENWWIIFKGVQYVEMEVKCLSLVLCLDASYCFVWGWALAFMPQCLLLLLTG